MYAPKNVECFFIHVFDGYKGNDEQYRIVGFYPDLSLKYATCLENGRVFDIEYLLRNLGKIGDRFLES